MVTDEETYPSNTMNETTPVFTTSIPGNQTVMATTWSWTTTQDITNPNLPDNTTSDIEIETTQFARTTTQTVATLQPNSTNQNVATTAESPGFTTENGVKNTTATTTSKRPPSQTTGLPDLTTRNTTNVYDSTKGMWELVAYLLINAITSCLF